MNPVLDYHERSKHHLDHYAPGPGGLDWATQPDPFRRYTGALELDLPLLARELPIRWDDLFGPAQVPQQPLNAENLAKLLQLRLSPSAWPQRCPRWLRLRMSRSAGSSAAAVPRRTSMV